MTTYLQRAHQAEQAATPGPWRSANGAGCRRIKSNKSGSHRQAQYTDIAHTLWLHDEFRDHANAKLIAKTRNEYRALLAVVAAAQKRAANGHDDDCTARFDLNGSLPCSCGHEPLRASLAALEALP